MNRSVVRIGLAGKLLLAAFLPAQIPFAAYVIALRTRVDPINRTEALVIAAALSIGIAAYLIERVVWPIRMTRHRLHKMADEHHLVPPGTSNLIDDETILGSLDRSIAELQEAGHVDPLTGVGNRRACQERLQQDLARARRSDQGFTLAFFDLDRLKEVNDRLGHPAGDCCLLHLVSTIRANVREGDWIARWGGDEFVLMLWNANEAQAREICDRVLAAVREFPVDADGTVVSVTASVGIAQADLKQDTDTLMHNADRALLCSKREGKDRSSVFEWR